MSTNVGGSSAYCILPTAYSLAAGFITPALFITGLALAAIPIIIHILNRRRFKTVQWAAMEFLLKAMRKNRKRLRFEQWLLLATRCLVLGLLGAALARPLACDQNTIASLAGDRNALHVIVIDNSYSMAYEADRPDAKTHLDQAKRLAKGLIDRLSAGGESVAIITASQPARGVIVPPTFDLDAARGAIDLVEQSYAGTDLYNALQQALELGEKESRQPRKFLYLLTDATRSAWVTPQAQNVREIGTELAKHFRVAHFNLGRQSQWNHAVRELRPTENLVTSRFNSEFVSTIQTFGSGPAANVQWKLDDRVLPGGGQARQSSDPQEITLSQLSIKTGGPHVITAQIVDDDRLRLDNVRHRVVEVTSKLNVLIVEGDRGLGPLAGSAAFLQLALAPPKEANANETGGATDSYIETEVISDLELPNKVLGEYRAVVLTNIGQVTTAQADQLKHFVEQGGTLLLFMGEQVDAGNYNTVLLTRSLLPGTLTKLMSVGTDAPGFSFDFKPNDIPHPLLHLFRNEEKSGLDTAQIFKYWQIELRAEPNIQRVLNYTKTSSDDSAGTDASADSADLMPDPAITVHTLGLGRVVFFSTTANADWTSFPAKPAYVPLMHEILAGSIDGGDGWMNLSVGQRVEIPRNIKLTAAPILSDPMQTPIPLDQTAGAGGLPVYRSREITRPGVYSLKTGQRVIPIVVNAPSDEADVQTLEDAAVRSALGDIEIDLQPDQLPAVAETEQDGNDMGWSFMIAVLALVAAECLMAMTFGHYRRKQG